MPVPHLSFKPTARTRPQRTPAQGEAGPSRYGDEGDTAPVAPSAYTPVPPKAVPFLSFRPIARPRPSAPPPPSPGSMAPPPEPSRRRGGPESDVLVDSVVELPHGDTPRIVKNREMRKDAARRSSLGLRGQRASSSFGRGEPSYPHHSVAASQFHKHLPAELPEPLKARYLIVWCAKRALDEYRAAAPSKKRKHRGGASAVADENDAEKLFSDVFDDFASLVARGEIDTNVFGPGPSASSSSSTKSSAPSMPIRPHPRNIANRELEAKETAVIKQSSAEDRAWGRIAAQANARARGALSGTTKGEAGSTEDVLRDAKWFERALKLADQVIAQTEADIGSNAEFGEVEFKVDTLQQTSHAARQYSLQATRFLDGIFGALAADLRAKDAPPLPGSTTPDEPDTLTLLSAAAGSASAPGIAAPTTRKHDAVHLLRALAASDARSATEEAVARATTAAAVAATTTVSATPRRPVTSGPAAMRPGTTPRRAGVYGRAATPGR